MSDYGYIIPHIQMATQLNHRGTNTWLYAFNYRSQNYPEPSWMGKNVIMTFNLFYAYYNAKKYNDIFVYIEQ